MINSAIRKQIEAATKAAKTASDWKDAVRAFVSQYGDEAIYYVDGSRFLEKGEMDAGCNPCHNHVTSEWGVAVKAAFYNKEEDWWQDYVSTMVWIG